MNYNTNNYLTINYYILDTIISDISEHFTNLYKLDIFLSLGIISIVL